MTLLEKIKTLKDLPKLYAQETNRNPTVYYKLFLPGTSWTWYITEGQQEDDQFICFGYTYGLDEEPELGYFSIDELQEVKTKLQAKVELDITFEPAPWYNVEEKHKLEHGIKN